MAQTPPRDFFVETCTKLFIHESVTKVFAKMGWIAYWQKCIAYLLGFILRSSTAIFVNGSFKFLLDNTQGSNNTIGFISIAIVNITYILSTMGNVWSEFDEHNRREQERVEREQERIARERERTAHERERLDARARENYMIGLLQDIHAQRAVPTNLQNQIEGVLQQFAPPQGFQAVIPLEYNPVDLLTGDDLTHEVA